MRGKKTIFMRIFNWKRLREITLRGYEIDSSLDRDLDLLLRIKANEEKGDEYLVPKPSKRERISSIRLSRNNLGCNYFLQEYPHDIDYLDDSVIVPSTVIEGLGDYNPIPKPEPSPVIRPVRVNRGCLGYSYYLKEYPHDIDYLDDSIIVPGSILKR